MNDDLGYMTTQRAVDRMSHGRTQEPVWMWDPVAREYVMLGHVRITTLEDVERWSDEFSPQQGSVLLHPEQVYLTDGVTEATSPDQKETDYDDEESGTSTMDA